MHRTAFAAKTRPEFLEHAIALHQHAPESIRVFAVIGTVFFVPIERDRVLNLVRHLLMLTGRSNSASAFMTSW